MHRAARLLKTPFDGHPFSAVIERKLVLNAAYISAHFGDRFYYQGSTVPKGADMARSAMDRHNHWIAAEGQIAFNGQVAIAIFLPRADAQPLPVVVDGIDSQARRCEKGKVAFAADEPPCTREIRMHARVTKAASKRIEPDGWARWWLLSARSAPGSAHERGGRTADDSKC